MNEKKKAKTEDSKRQVTVELNADEEARFQEFMRRMNLRIRAEAARKLMFDQLDTLQPAA